MIVNTSTLVTAKNATSQNVKTAAQLARASIQKQMKAACNTTIT